MLRCALICAVLLCTSSAMAARRAATIGGGTLTQFHNLRARKAAARGVNSFQTFGSVNSTGRFFNFGRSNQFLPLNGAAVPILVIP